MRSIDYNELTDELKAKIQFDMQELISLANGLEDDDVQISLRPGSLIIDATVNMPTSAGEPVVPTTRAVGRILRFALGRSHDIDQPRMDRADRDDELWRAAEQGVSNIEDEYEAEWPAAQNATGEQNKRRLPLKLEFERARAHAIQAQSTREEKLARNQLRQPELSPDMSGHLFLTFPEHFRDISRSPLLSVHPGGGVIHFNTIH